MLIFKHKQNIINIEKDCVVSFFNKSEDKVCICLPAIENNSFFISAYIFKTKELPDINFEDINEVVDLISEGQIPLIMLSCSSDDDVMNIEETLDILNKFDFDIDIKWYEEMENILMN